LAGPSVKFERRYDEANRRNGVKILAARMRKLDLNLLLIVFALYDELSVSRAAQALGMSQPAVSMALRKLRTTFNDPLFIRAPSGVTPTPRAHALVRAARPLVERLQQDLLAEERFDPQASTRTISISLSDVGELVFLPKLLERFRARAPQCAIRSVSIPPAQLAHGLEDGEIDLAVGYFPDLTKHDFLQQRLFTHHFACLMRAGHPRLAKRLSLEDFLAMEHAVVHAEGRTQELFERFLERKRIRRKVVLHTPHFLSIPIVIARSELVATVPHALAIYCARMSHDLVFAMPPFDIAGFDVNQHWHRKFDNDPRSRWLREQVASLFNDETDEWQET
jgi:DNA-binding transcriptional LysR family regulator